MMDRPQHFISQALLRSQVFADLSSLYAAEVPLYGTLLKINCDVNAQVAKEHPELHLKEEQLRQISAERHGAIRLGKREELKWMGRFFAVLDMFAVNFYNLADAGQKSQPVLGTAFRPLHDPDQRMFCSLLVTDFFDKATKVRIEKALESREIFTLALKEMIEIYERQKGLTIEQSLIFRNEAKELFYFRNLATDYPLYQDLYRQGVNIAADIACFPNPHLNHLTPNSLDIDRLFDTMKHVLQQSDFEMKDTIEGPPPPENPDDALCFLRQTAYKALAEPVEFFSADGTHQCDVMHTARFGEVEQRGVALTPKGRTIYDAAIQKTDKINPQLALTDYEEYVRQYRACFKDLPKTHDELCKFELGYYTFHFTGAGKISDIQDGINRSNVYTLVEKGLISYTPIRYEDFLPVSAAGIFAANLKQYGTAQTASKKRVYSKEILESALDAKIYDSNDLYEEIQNNSLIALNRK